jgi:hypothetical protein
VFGVWLEGFGIAFIDIYVGFAAIGTFTLAIGTCLNIPVR